MLFKGNEFLFKLVKVKSLSQVRLFATPWTIVDRLLCHGILQARILEWVIISFSRGSSRLRDRTRVSCIGGRCFNLWATREAVFIMLSYTTFYTHFVESFYYEWMLNFVKCFFCIYWDDHMFPLILLMWCITSVDLWMLHHPWFPGIITVYDSSNVLLNSVC